MVEPLLIIGGAVAAYGLLTKKKEAPKPTPSVEVKKVLEEMPPEVMEEVKREVISEAAPEKVGECVKVEREWPTIAATSGMGSLLDSLVQTDKTGQSLYSITEVGREVERKFQQRLADYKAKGWSIHKVIISTATLRSSITYACPPGVFPIEFQAQLKQIIKTNACVYPGIIMNVRGRLPFPVLAELKTLGWTTHTVEPKPLTPIQVATGVTPSATTWLCPPGKKPA